MKLVLTLGYIIESLLFLFHIHDLEFVSNVLDTIMFADDTNLFYSHKDINFLFLKVNKEVHEINQWFISNKLLLNIKSQSIYFSISEVKRMIFPFYFLN